MGVNNLWKLLAAAGRTVSIETLRNKTLAIDISIWMVQFIKAMKNDQVSWVVGSVYCVDVAVLHSLLCCQLSDNNDLVVVICCRARCFQMLTSWEPSTDCAVCCFTE